MRYTSAAVVKSSFKLFAISGTLNTPKASLWGRQFSSASKHLFAFDNHSIFECHADGMFLILRHYACAVLLERTRSAQIRCQRSI